MRCETVLGFTREATAMCLLKKDAHDLLIMMVSYVFENLAAGWERSLPAICLISRASGFNVRRWATGLPYRRIMSWIMVAGPYSSSGADAAQRAGEPCRNEPCGAGGF